MKYIFLDIDGVINNPNTKEKSTEGHTGIDGELVKLFKRIIDATNAKVVLTSSWKKDYICRKPDGVYLDKALKMYGLEISDIVGDDDLTPDRGEQIRKYIDTHKEISNFVILDDEFVEFFKRYNLQDNLVHTNYLTGITEKDVKKAIEILNKRKKVLFICHGNICRSPMAEFIMKSLTNDFYIESAATSIEEIGNYIYPLAREELVKHNIKGFENKTARQVTKSDYDTFDYLVIMDEENRSGLMRIIRNDPDGKVMKLIDKDIDDPWYTRDFDKCYKDIYRGCKELLERISTR